MQAIDVARALGDTTGKVIIDTRNVVRGRGPAGFANTTDAILARTATTDVVKCFNTSGFENILNPAFGDQCSLLEQLAMSWITLAIFRGYGRCIAFKIMSL